jgi:molybdenum cofactor cytidylyltransferase
MAGVLRPAQGAQCGAVVLAAGEARRFGCPKLLMPFGDSTVLGSAVGTLACAGVTPIVVVVGANAAAVSEALSALRQAQDAVQIVCNSNPDAGMISSVRVGAEALASSLDRFLIALGDQPRIRPEGVSHLIAEHVATGMGIAIPTYQGRRGHPVVFDISYRREILALTHEQTLRDLIEAHRDEVVEVGCDSDAYVRDIDTREDYERELTRWRDERS